MEVKIVLFNVLSPYMNDGKSEFTEVTLPTSDSTTLRELFDALELGSADVSKYYPVSTSYYYNQNSLPYIIRTNGKVDWEPTYENIRVIDFINTHGITDNIIHVDTGIPQAGGPDLKDFIQLWNEYYPLLDQIATVFGFGSGIAGIGLFIKSLFVRNKKSVPPHGVFDLILSKNKWNHFELSELLEIDKEEAKKLLQGLGYKWNNSMKLYIHTGEIDKVREKLRNVSFWEHG